MSLKYTITIADEPLKIENCISEQELKIHDEKYICYISGSLSELSILEKNVFLAAYAYKNKIIRAYKVLSDGVYAFIIRENENEKQYVIDIIDTSKGSDLSYHLELTFAGSERIEISESLEELEKLYNFRENNVLFYIVIAVVALIVVFGAIYLFTKKPTVIQQPQQKEVPPLSEKEILDMKRIGGTLFIEDVKNKVKAIFDSSTLKNAAQIDFVELKYTVSKSTLETTANFKTNYNFPIENSVLENDHYTQINSSVFKIDRKLQEFENNNTLVCLGNILAQNNFKVTTIERKQSTIKFQFEDFKASDLLTFEIFLKECNGYFDILRIGSNPAALYILVLDK